MNRLVAFVKPYLQGDARSGDLPVTRQNISVSADPSHLSSRVIGSRVNAAAILSLYGTAHLVVDAICAAVVFRIASAENTPADGFVGVILLYHALAFGLQAVFGIAVDVTRMPRLAAVLGCLVTASALVCPSIPLLGIVLSGIGNAMFHVGGGYISLRITPQRATVPGLFVAPGSLGLLLGAILGTTGKLDPIVLLPIALVLCVLMALSPVLAAEPVPRRNSSSGRREFVLGCILLAIGIRSLLGFLLVFSWESQAVLLVVLTLATVAGKALGGVLADRWGWMQVAVGSAIAALPFLACASTYPVLLIPGMLLVNLGMPVTLAAMAEALPGYPGFAFGLTCLAVLIGGLPPLLGAPVKDPASISLMVLLLSAALYCGLRPWSFNPSIMDTEQECE